MSKAIRLALAGAGALACIPALAQQKNPDKNAYFGETHVHTSWSPDAWLFGNKITGPVSGSTISTVRVIQDVGRPATVPSLAGDVAKTGYQRGTVPVPDRRRHGRDDAAAGAHGSHRVQCTG